MKILPVLTLSLLPFVTFAGVPEEAKFPDKDTPEASIHRGSLVFQSYCTLCHGANADGTGRAAKMYTPKPSNLRESMLGKAYWEQIIRKGGAEMKRSEFMPPWKEELTEEQINDVLNFIESINTHTEKKKDKSAAK